MRQRYLFLLALLFALALSAQGFVYVGTYTKGPSKGIYGFRYNARTGSLIPLGLSAETDNPTFLAVHPNQRFLYAVNEVSEGAVTSYAIDAVSGALKKLNRVSAKGDGPCHLSLDHSGKWLYIANYGSGSVASFPVHDDGTLGEASAFFQHAGHSVDPRQAGPHAHDVVVSPANRFVMVADLGLDQLLRYRIDAASGGLAPKPAVTPTKPGAGPRHLVFRTDAKFMYVLNEIASTVAAYKYDATTGNAQELQTLSTLPANFTGKNSTAEIALDPMSNFLYTSNRGDDSIAIFHVDAAAGTLTFVERVPTGGKTPRNFAIDPAGKFLFAANQDSGNIVTFRMDSKSGSLTPNGTVTSVPSAVSIVFVEQTRESRKK